MKTLYLDLCMGAAGDMLTAALYELLDEDRKAGFIKRINSLGLDSVTVNAVNSVKCGITGTHMDVRIDGAEEHEHHHDHDHEHHHDHHEHHHSSLNDIEQIVDTFPLDESIRSNIKKIYGIIADAESHAHNCPVSDIHFHEVGTKDAIVDVTSVCLLIDMLSPDRIIASPVCTGFGQVKCAHGILPVPAPATADILKDIPVYAGDMEEELCTPTGAALVKFFADDFSRMPLMKVVAVGYGMGTKDLAAANCVRAFWGEEDSTKDDIVELSCNVDDMTGEEIGYATELFLNEGALDVYTSAIGMKRSRPGIKITLMCHPDEKEKFVSLMFKYTTTIGIRENAFSRYVLDRKTECADTSYGSVRIKKSDGYGISRNKVEYEDLKNIALSRNVSIREARELIRGELNGG